MKNLLLMLAISALAFPLAACESDGSVSHAESTKTNWDGSTTHKETTVRENPGGAVTVDEQSTRTR